MLLCVIFQLRVEELAEVLATLFDSGKMPNLVLSWR